jgi:hypothetical protein
VISGQQLPKVDKTKETTVVDPLVKVELYGVPEDTKEQETSHVENNGELGHGEGSVQTADCLLPHPPFGHLVQSMGLCTLMGDSEITQGILALPYRLTNWEKFLCFF